MGRVKSHKQRQSSLAVEYLDWTEEQQREWLRALAVLCIETFIEERNASGTGQSVFEGYTPNK
ncbi:MAG: hypothetical protein QF793_01510, partial [Candidatus Peribacteraceae bacterium]|nr:hypothetical protein [Candidatus Peribacteraceae bacterium]